MKMRINFAFFAVTSFILVTYVSCSNTKQSDSKKTNKVEFALNSETSGAEITFKLCM